jgi:hypothetical protein
VLCLESFFLALPTPVRFRSALSEELTFHLSGGASIRGGGHGSGDQSITEGPQIGPRCTAKGGEDKEKQQRMSGSYCMLSPWPASPAPHRVVTTYHTEQIGLYRRRFQ